MPGKEWMNYAFCGQLTPKREEGVSEPRMSSLLFLNCIAHKSLLSHPSMVWNEQSGRKKPEVLH